MIFIRDFFAIVFVECHYIKKKKLTKLPPLLCVRNSGFGKPILRVYSNLSVVCDSCKVGSKMLGKT